MAVLGFQGTGKAVAGNPPVVVNVAHLLVDNAGAKAIPTLFWAVPQTLCPAAAALNTMVVTVDATNVILTAAGNYAADVVFDVFAIVMANIQQSSNALSKVTARPGVAVTTPTGEAPVRWETLQSGSIAVTGTQVVTLATDLALVTVAEGPIVAIIDNPWITGAFDSLTAPTTFTLTNRDALNAQFTNVLFFNVHSIVK